MITKVSTSSMIYEERSRGCKEGIGGSNASVVCGLNPYASPTSVCQDKTSQEIGVSDDEAICQGRDPEGYMARRFTEAIGPKVREGNMMYVNSWYSFVLTNADRLAMGEDAGLECKTVSVYNADKWEDGEIPPHYAIQCYHYMAVMRRKNWYIAMVVSGRGFQYRKSFWDEGMIRNLIPIGDDS